MKTAFRSIASVLLGFLLWFGLYIVLLWLFIFAVVSFPTVANIVDWLVTHLHAEHLYSVLLMGVPAIVPAILVRRIMKGAPEKTQKWTVIVIISVIAIAILLQKGLSLLDKIEGIFSSGLILWVVAKER